MSNISVQYTKVRGIKVFKKVSILSKKEYMYTFLTHEGVQYASIPEYMDARGIDSKHRSLVGVVLEKSSTAEQFKLRIDAALKRHKEQQEYKKRKA